MAAQNQNQSKQTPVKGAIHFAKDGGAISAQLDSTTAGNIVPGTCVKCVDSSGGIPKVVECDADENDVFGVVLFDGRHQNYDSGDRLEILRDGALWMEASAAIARNADVMLVVTGSKIATATSTNRIIGKAYDKCSADGDLIPVLVKLPGALA